MEQKKQTGRNGGTLNVGGTFEGVGRPKKLPNLDELGAQLLSEEKSGMTALEAVIKSMIHKAVKGDTTAAKLVLDRFYGLAAQKIDHTTKGESLNSPFNSMDLNKRIAILEILESESDTAKDGD
jgi:hypothetical protein